MQKAQGRPRHDKDRLESSGRQKKEWKDLQVQLKRAGGGEMETAESAPVRHYYRKLPGGELARERDGVRVKRSFSGELERPARCKTGGQRYRNGQKNKKTRR